MGFPLMVRAIRLSIEAVDRKLEAAARTLGAGPFDVFLSMTLPLALPGVLVGIVLAFARGLGEFGATIIFVGNIPGETRTIPIAIYTLTQDPEGDLAALRLSIISVVLALIALDRLRIPGAPDRPADQGLEPCSPSPPKSSWATFASPPSSKGRPAACSPCSGVRVPARPR